MRSRSNRITERQLLRRDFQRVSFGRQDRKSDSVASFISSHDSQRRQRQEEQASYLLSGDFAGANAPLGILIARKAAGLRGSEGSETMHGQQYGLKSWDISYRNLHTQ